MRFINFKKSLVILGLVVTLGFTTLPGASFTLNAGAATDPYKERERLNSEAAQIKNQLKEYDKQQASAEKKRDALNAQITNTKRQIENYNTQISGLNKDIESKNAEIAQKEQELEDIRQLFKDRIRSIYIAGQNSEIEVVLGANDFADFLAKTELMRSITESDNKLMVTVRENIAAVNEAKASVEKNKIEVTASRNAQKKKQDELDLQMAELQGTLKQIKGAIDDQKKEQQKIANDLINIDKEIAVLIEKAKQRDKDTGNPTIFEGSFKWPVPGYYTVTSPFGYRNSPTGGGWKMHNGIDISGGSIYGKPVVAAADGIIIMASWYDSYGNCVMIDHGTKNGNRYITLYAHLSGYATSSGASVKAGQTIGYIGSTGNSTGPHLHYEIRENSSPKNPLGYYQ